MNLTAASTLVASGFIPSFKKEFIVFLHSEELIRFSYRSFIDESQLGLFGFFITFSVAHA